METATIKLVYGKEEFELSEQELDRIIAIASKKLRDSVISMKLGFMPIKRNELRNENDVKVIKDGYESELYRAMSETLVYAIENGDLDNYLLASERENFNVSELSESTDYKIDRKAISNLARMQNNSAQLSFKEELNKILSTSKYYNQFIS